jgi:hypothetical protein
MNNLSYIQFGKEHGKSFRIVKTPAGMSTRDGKTIPDAPGRISIVTPENGDSFNWPKADKGQIKMMRKNWSKIQRDPGSQYKMNQIRRSMQ